MYQVKATMVAWLGDEERYPCHFGHKIGDEFIFDGEKFIGKICPYVISLIMQPMQALCQAGPKYRDPYYYVPFWYVPLSVRDESMKACNGGWKARPEDLVEPPYSHGRAFIPKGSYTYPINEKRDVCQDVTVVCPDQRSGAVFKLEAFALAEGGAAPPFFRKAMAVLRAVKDNDGVPVDEVPQKLSRAHREEIWPLAAPVFIEVLIEELEAARYLKIREGRAYITKAGEAKLKSFAESLTAEEREALEIEP